MQHIFHHNSSGNDAFTGDLLSREVLRAISLHPIKQSKYLYRLHNFLNMRKIMNLRHRKALIGREIFKLNRLSKNSSLQQGLTDENYFGDENEFISVANRFKVPPKLNLIKPTTKRQDRSDFDFFTRSLFSPTYVSPKRGLESYWRRSLIDNIRQLMDEINSNSIKRGRLIDFKDLLYGYMRFDPLIGLDYILDILLVYRRYEGKKMTVPVRRHAYVRQTFDDLLFREDNLRDSIYLSVTPISMATNDSSLLDFHTQSQAEGLSDKLLAWLGLSKLNQSRSGDIDETLKPDLGLDESKLVWMHQNLDPNNAMPKYIFSDGRNNFMKNSYEVSGDLNLKTINFILPLSGRWEIFQRFMANFEDVCLRTNQEVNLIVVLFEASNDASSRQQGQVIELFERLRSKYLTNRPNSLRLVVSKDPKFSRSIGCELGAADLADNQLLFFIDVDIVFTYDFLTRVRLNTIEGKQVYYPIVFSEYDPDDAREALKESTGSPPFMDSRRRVTRREPKHFEISAKKGY